MSVLFGHPTGNPNSHHAALAHFESGRLQAFCVPWMPSSATLRRLNHFAPLQPVTRRLARRYFPALEDAPKIQGRLQEISRLGIRLVGLGDERLSYNANDWLMRTMRRESWRQEVSAVHAYEDCSLWQFVEAKRLGKACIYDMPIGYYPAWEAIQARLACDYADWMPNGGVSAGRYVRPDQKRREMELADLVMVPCSFAESTVRSYHPRKTMARAIYGVDLEFWRPPRTKATHDRLRFIFAGQLSLRKGIPFLLSVWQKAALRDAELELVGQWQLAEARRSTLPPNVICRPPCAPEELRDRYRDADVFIFPSFFEGFGLVLLEAMACGLPVLSSDASAAPDLVTEACGRVIPSGQTDAWVEALRSIADNRGKLPAMALSARSRAEQFTWRDYRHSVSEAVAPYV